MRQGGQGKAGQQAEGQGGNESKERVAEESSGRQRTENGKGLGDGFTAGLPTAALQGS